MLSVKGIVVFPETVVDAVQPYLDELSARIERSAPGQTIAIAPPPIFMRADPNHMGLLHITPLNIYSLPSWAALRHPDRHILFQHETLSSPRPDEVAREADEAALIVRVSKLHRPKRRAARARLHE